MFKPWVEKTPWRRKWQLAPVFVPEKSQQLRSLVGYSLWGHKELDTHTHTHTHTHKQCFGLVKYNRASKILKTDTDLLVCS